MLILGPIGFAAPWILAGLLGLPLLWALLRAVPPAPIRHLFPGVILLLGLADRNTEADRTPWWLLLLRMLAIAAMIVGFSGPVLNPENDPAHGVSQDAAQDASGIPLLVFLDDSWAAAPDWQARLDLADDMLQQAARAGRLAMVVGGNSGASDGAGPGPVFTRAQDIAARLPGLAPQPWGMTYSAAKIWADELENIETVWISDGLEWPGRMELLRSFQRAGDVQIHEPPTARLALRPVENTNDIMAFTALRSHADTPSNITIIAYGSGPDGGDMRVLARVPVAFGNATTIAEAKLALPPELRNRISHFAIQGLASAGAISLADDGLRRRRIGLVDGGADREGLELLSPLHYLRTALAPGADLIEGAIGDLITSGADVIVLADVAGLSQDEHLGLSDWVAKGGLLLRFAGPRLAAADLGRGVDDALLPVRLRAGGRVVGGAMSWGQARAIAPFAAGSVFYGLRIPDEVTVSAQVLAEPGPELAARTIATLIDGTPLVTQKTMGKGRVALFHITANTEWSGLPLSGLFVEMLERLAVSTGGARRNLQTLEGTTWRPIETLDGFGVLGPVRQLRAQQPVPGAKMNALAHAGLAPGIYGADARRLAVNITGRDSVLTRATWPAGIVPQWGGTATAQKLSGWLWLMALAALAVDAVAALALSGRLAGQKTGQRTGQQVGARTGSVLLLALGVFLWPDPVMAQDTAPEDAYILAAAEVTLAYVLTGDDAIDRVSAAGLTGLSQQLFRRTSVAPAPPQGIDLEREELALFPLLYWPVSLSQPRPSATAYARLGQYLGAGGMVLFDTRNAHIGGFGNATSPIVRHLQYLTEPLDIPPLEPVPKDHVLTRAFYLLETFPGRHAQGNLWVEAAPADAELAEGMPFRNLNDGVSPVLIGSNDWASAWAIRPDGAPMFPVGRGRDGQRQREMAYRFGINLVMHVLTGNYKSDQVHVPALLERLGQ